MFLLQIIAHELSSICLDVSNQNRCRCFLEYWFDVVHYTHDNFFFEVWEITSPLKSIDD